MTMKMTRIEKDEVRRTIDKEIEIIKAKLDKSLYYSAAGQVVLAKRKSKMKPKKAPRNLMHLAGKLTTEDRARIIHWMSTMYFKHYNLTTVYFAPLDMAIACLRYCMTCDDKKLLLKMGVDNPKHLSKFPPNCNEDGEKNADTKRSRRRSKSA